VTATPEPTGDRLNWFLDGRTPGQVHDEAVADTGEAYTSWQGWILRCAWCDWEVKGATKRACVDAMQKHYMDVGAASRVVMHRSEL